MQQPHGEDLRGFQGHVVQGGDLESVEGVAAFSPSTRPLQERKSATDMQMCAYQYEIVTQCKVVNA